MTVYDRIGIGYADRRRADPRVAAQILDALRGARRVVNVGAGAGSYEPDTTLVAVEPSAVMLAQRLSGSAPAVRAVAEALPLPDACGDAGLASMTVHHWHDPGAGLDELLRVAPARTVVFAWDKAVTYTSFWLMDDYLPEIADLEVDVPGSTDIAALLRQRGRTVRTEVVPVPADCTDGFGAAYWARPEAYLDPTVAASISGLALLDASVRARGLARLRDDLASGAWLRKHGDALAEDSYDAGYRLLVATPA